jgi:hypothetical protein
MTAASISIVLLAALPAQAIAGGAPVADGSYGFVAKLVIGEERSCSGVLIDPQWIITAKSCFPENGSVPGAPKKKTTATLGRTTLSDSNGHVVDVVHLVPHPNRDVVRAKLAQMVIDVPRATLIGDPLVQNEPLIAAGYGRTAGEWAPNKLHSATVSVADISAAAINVASAGAEEKSACKGDAGGPVFRERGTWPGPAKRYEVAAIHTASWQHGCFSETEVRQGWTATRVDDLGEWIYGEIRERDWMVNVNSEMCLGAGSSKAGTPVSQAPCVKSALDQRWTVMARDVVTPRPRPTHIGIQIRNGHGLCLDVEGGAVLRGKLIVQAACVDNRESQKWTVPAGALVGRINSFGWLDNGEKLGCIGIGGGSKVAGAKAILWSCSGVQDQNWVHSFPAYVRGTPLETFSTPVSATRSSMRDALADGPGLLIEDFAYPNAAAILATHNIRLNRGNGYILFTDCTEPVKAGEGRIDVESSNINGHAKRFCFRVTSRSGWLSLEVPAVYAIDGRKAGAGSKVTAEVTTDDGEHTTVDVSPTQTTPVGVGADPENKPTTLLELRVTG